jgi:hypothetical protein
VPSSLRQRARDRFDVLAGSRLPVAGLLVVVLAGLGALVAAMVPTGPSWLSSAGAVAVASAYTWALAARTGGRPVVVALLALGTIAVTLALAFGFGAREVARSLASGRYAQADFEVGQTIRVGDVRGEILRIDAAAVTLSAGDETIRIPNSMLVERIVIVEDAAPRDV